MNPRLKEQYVKVIVPNIQKKLSLKNKLTVPKIRKGSFKHGPRRWWK